MGTWQFRSVAILAHDPRKSHEVHDDIESLYWVLLFTSVCHANHQSTRNVTMILAMFDEKYAYHTDGVLVPRGGDGKRGFLTLQLYKVVFKCDALTKLLGELQQFFKGYGAGMFAIGNSSLKEFDALRKDLSQGAEMFIKILQDALDGPGWLEGDIVHEQ